jgi:hypothetical protein
MRAGAGVAVGSTEGGDGDCKDSVAIGDGDVAQPARTSTKARLSILPIGRIVCYLDEIAKCRT